MTLPLKMNDMFIPLLNIAPDFCENCPALSLVDDETDQILPYAVLSELAGFLIDRLGNGDTGRFKEVFEVVEAWHVQGDPDVKTAATIGLLEDLQNVNLHNKTDPTQFCKWLLPETALAWKGLSDFWSGDR